jgi:hypothetical protein
MVSLGNESRLCAIALAQVQHDRAAIGGFFCEKSSPKQRGKRDFGVADIQVRK